MSTRPRYVQNQVLKWDKSDIDAVTDHVLAGETVSGFLAYPYRFLVRSLAGGVYDAVDATGTRVYGGPEDAGEPSVDGNDAGAVLMAACSECATNSGLIFLKNGVYPLGTTPLAITLQEAPASPTPFALVGETTKAILTYTGTGHALSLTTNYATYESVQLANFTIDCGAVTDDRHGLQIYKVGRNTVVDRLRILNTDVGIDVDDTNEVYFYNTRVQTANTGIRTGNVGDTNEISFINCQALTTNTYGVYMNGGNAMNWRGGMISPLTGTGLYLNTTWTSTFDNVYFHDDPASTGFNFHININGSSASYPSTAILFKNCYFNGHSNTNYAANIKYGSKISFENCKSRLHNVAFIFLESQNHDLKIDNLYFEEPYLLDGSLSTVDSRFAGSVSDSRRNGIIAHNGSGVTLTEGDVVCPSGNGAVTKTDHTYGPTFEVPMVIMHGNLDGKPVVCMIKGISKVNVDGNVAVRDTLVVSTTTDGFVTPNNAVVDPKKILGYAFENNTGGAGQYWAKVL